VLITSRSKSPIQKERESLDLSRPEFAQEAGMALETLEMVEKGECLLLSRLLANKLACMFPDATPEKLMEEYAAWRRLLEAERDRRS